MSTFKFNLNNLAEKPFEFYLKAAAQNPDIFQKNLLAFNYIQISSYKGMKELFRNESLIKPRSYKKIGKAYNLEGSLINDGKAWKIARDSTQKTLLNITEKEIQTIADKAFETFKVKVETNKPLDLLPIARVFVQSCINLIFFNTCDWNLNSQISFKVRELEEIMFSQQFSPVFQIFGTNYLFLKTKNKRHELENIFAKNFSSLNKPSRFNNWKLALLDYKTHDDFLFNEIFNFWVAANEATSNTICWALYIISEELKNKPNFSINDDSIFKSLQEAQRFYPAAYFIAREATKDISYNGEKIKKGSIINFSTYAMNRDTTHFSKPNELDSQTKYNSFKSNKPPYSFGHGKRVCSGRAIAECLMPYFIKKLTAEFKLKPNYHRPIPLAHVSLTSKNGFKFTLEPKLNCDTHLDLGPHKSL